MAPELLCGPRGASDSLGGGTEDGPAWCIHAHHITPLPVQDADPCLKPGKLGHFLEEAFRAWLARKISDLFRKTFRESLLELYERADL